VSACHHFTKIDPNLQYLLIAHQCAGC
jgi:hypothetical protein